MKIFDTFTKLISSFFDYFNFIFNGISKNTMLLPILIAILTAFLTGYFTYQAQRKIEDEKIQQNKAKVQQIVNAEIIENLEVANKFIGAKNEIVSDVNFVSFLQDQRFYTDSLREILTTNFQYLDENDVYHIAIIRDKLNQLNKKFDKMELQTQNKRISDKLECNFLYFLPEEKYHSFRFTADDFNRLIFSIKQLSFFQGNPFVDLNEYFEITKGRVSVQWFTYNQDYKDVNVNCN